MPSLESQRAPDYKESMRRALLLLFLVLILVGSGFLFFRYYPYLFAKDVKGRIVKVERVIQPSTIVGGNVPSSQIFSFAVAIQDEKGEIHTASSEDRQWAVAETGKCAEARFYPYAPWELDRAGTYHGARLLKLHDCVPAQK